MRADPTGLTWPPSSATRLTGSVVELVPLVPQRDAAALFDALDHPSVWQHLPSPPRDAVHYAGMLADRLAEGRAVWLVRLVRAVSGLPAGAVVGTSSYLGVSVPDARLEIGATAYRPAVWGGTVNPECKLLLLEHAFEVLGAGRVQLVTDIRNARSRRAIERLGARQEGILRSYQRRSDGTMRDTVVFSVLTPEWPAVRDGLLARIRAAEFESR